MASSPLQAVEEDTAPSPFVDIANILMDHDYLPTHFGYLIDNALVYISGWVVKKIIPKMSFEECKNSLVTPAQNIQMEESYHLLILRNEGNLMVPSKGTVKVVRSVERCLRRSSNVKSASHQYSLCQVLRVVRSDIGADDVFNLGTHFLETQDGIDIITTITI